MYMKKTRIIALCVVVFLFLGACSNPELPQNEDVTAVPSESTDIIPGEDDNTNGLSESNIEDNSLQADIESNVSEAKFTNLSEGINRRPRRDKNTVDGKMYSPQITDFGVKLLGKCNEDDVDQNVFVSPLSVIMALSMTANGAEGDTLAQMEKTLGLSVEELNDYADFCRGNLAKVKSNAGKLNIANSLWFKDTPDLKVNEDFLQTTANHFDAQINSAPFDQSTVSEINNWVKSMTDGMIPSIIDKIDNMDMMMVLNAVYFDARWRDPILKENVEVGIFYTDNDGRKKVPFMNDSETLYLLDDKAQGFIKPYKGGKFAFAALLPDDGVNVNDYLDSLSGPRLYEILSGAQNCPVYIKMPKFALEYEVGMNEVLKDLGMPRAFDKNNAEFEKMGHVTEGYQLFIGKVIHKTFIQVDENGTKAGAVSSVVMAGGAGGSTVEPKKVYLDRPFIYMIIDMETKVPYFIGVLNNPDV